MAQRRKDGDGRRDAAVLGLACVLVFAALGSLAASFLSPREQVNTEQESSAAVQTVEETPAEPSEEEPSERDAYIALWAERIDAFNAGYPLEGYGATFAAAAYDNGVDPRYSPAIARVESGSGLNCTYSCNAWGWGSSSWGDWDTAIYAHVAGLAQGYGHTISYAAAQSYNELNPDEWYAQVESCMYQIWESE